MGCASSVSVKEETTIKEAGDGKTVNGSSLSEEGDVVINATVVKENLEINNETIPTINVKDTSEETTKDSSWSNNSSLSIKNNSSSLHGRADKGDGISTKSLNSQLVSEDRTSAAGASETSEKPHDGTVGDKKVAMTESEIILEKALKELSESLFQSANISPTSGGTPKVTRSNHNETGEMRTSPTLTGETLYSEDLGYKIAVIDAGSGFCKAGLSGEDIPSVVIPTVVGRQREEGLIPGINADEAFIGNDAKLRREALTFTCPIERGVVKNWDDLEKVYDHILHMELDLERGDHGVVLPASPVTTRESREKLTELMFEKFNVKRLYLGSCASLALRALGMTTGLVVSFGHGISYATPIIQGNIVDQAVKTTNLGNQDVINYLQNSLQKENSSVQIDEDIARAMVEKMCYLSTDYTREMENEYKNQKTYTLPSGKIATLGRERFQCSEVMFRPSLIEGCQEISLPELCRKSLDATLHCDITTASSTDLHRNIVLVGAPSLLPGLNERLKIELSDHENSRVQALPKRQYASWRGASMLTSLRSSKHQWIDKKQYEDHGASIIHRKYV